EDARERVGAGLVLVQGGGVLVLVLLRLEQALWRGVLVAAQRLGLLGLAQPEAHQLLADLLVDLVAADAREVVALAVEEQVDEQPAGALRRRRLTRAQLAVDVLQRVAGREQPVLLQRLADDLRPAEE